MLDAYIGEIQIFSFGYAPLDWALCDGAEVRIKDHPGLYALIGNTYGGNGVDKFRLPNLAGRAVCGHGTGPQLTPRKLGERFGANSVTLDQTQLPDHAHGISFFAPKPRAAKSNLPASGYYLGVPDNALIFAPATGTTPVKMAPNAAASNGGEPHENRQPLLALHFYIALRGQTPQFS